MNLFLAIIKKRNYLDKKIQLIRNKILFIGLLIIQVSSVDLSAQHLVVGMRTDGLLFYYNPNIANSTIAYANNHGSITGGNVIGLNGYGSSVYTFGKDTASGEYRVNRSDFTSVDYKVTGSIKDSVRSNNVIVNASTENFVSMVYDGRDFYFLSDNGSVYKNNSTTAAFSFAHKSAGAGYRFQSMSLHDGRLLVGATTQERNHSNILSYDIASGVHSLLIDQSYNFASGDATLVSGAKDGGLFYYSRADELIYGSNGEYLGKPPNSLVKVLGLATSDDLDAIYWVDANGVLRLSSELDEINNPALGTNSGAFERGIAIVNVIPELSNSAFLFGSTLFLAVLIYRKVA